jgi:hypothetical protein
VKANGNLDLCVLKKADFLEIMENYPSVAFKIRDTIRKRKEEIAKAKQEDEARKAQEVSIRRRNNKPLDAIMNRSAKFFNMSFGSVPSTSNPSLNASSLLGSENVSFKSANSTFES